MTPSAQSTAVPTATTTTGSTTKGRSSSSRAPRSRAKENKPSSTPSISESRLAGSAQQVPLLGPKIADMLRSIDPTLSIEPAAEDQVLSLVDDFVDKVVKQAMRVAQHRSSGTLEVVDIQLILDQQWGIQIPGLLPPVPKKKVSTTTASATSGSKRKASDKLSGAHKATKTTAGQSAGSVSGAAESKK